MDTNDAVINAVNTEKKTIIMLNSGGFDSVLLSKHLRYAYPEHNIVCLFFDYGQNNLEQEKMFAVESCNEINGIFEEIKLPPMSWTSSDFFKGIPAVDQETVDGEYLEWRNLIFLSYALSMAQAYKAEFISLAIIRMGGNKTPYPDSCLEFLRKFRDICSLTNVDLEVPFATYYKEELYHYAKKLGVKEGHFYSCNHPKEDGSPCGVCYDCQSIQAYRDYIDF